MCASNLRLTMALAASSLAAMQSVSAQNAEAGPNSLEQVVVTGSRITREGGYEAPTPVTVLTADVLQRGTATSNVADTLTSLPVFANSQSPASAVSGISAGTQGLNVLNLRGMGGNRTLTLFDGQRSVPSLFSGEVDVNNFPQQLIERVETVTGGASAVYGSDAVAGVVNFILDKDYTGLKSEFASGTTNYGDDDSYKAAVTGGFGFAEGRGHVLLSGEVADRDGVTPGDGGRDRDWNYGGWGILVNPAYTATNGQPEYLVRPEVSLSNATHGGIIISGPLRGIAFGEGGVPYQFGYGPITNDPWMQGGDWQDTEIRHDRSGTLEPANRRRNAFVRVSYDITEDTNVYLQAAWGDNRTYTATWPPFQAGNGPTLLSGNPFIPASVQAQMDTLGLESFRIGSMNYDLPTVINDVNRETNRYVVGIDGALGGTWKWNAYVQYGETTSITDVRGVVQTARYALALDAVRDPNGAIVCRSTLTNPTNGCVPWNPLGINVNGSNRQGLEYVTGTSSVEQTIEQKVYAASISGDVFSTWAGPVSVALSAEYREDEAKGVPSGGGPWFAGNFSAFSASNSVTEGAFETLLPLARDMAFAKNLDLNAAIRVTDYEFSGRVETWKVGAVWAPVDGLRFRATRSRDIRAPNFNELFAVGNSGQRSAFDPFTNTIPQYFGATTGNPELDPEEGDTYEVGVVFQPSFMRGFSASVDYWNIELSGAIASPNDNQTLLFCFQGRQEFCDKIQRDANGVITQVTLSPFNIASQSKSGIDIELTQQLDADSLISSWRGNLNLAALGTFYRTSTQDDGLGAGPYSTLGDMGQLLVGPPDWRLTTTATYSLEDFTASLSARLQSSGVIDARFIECSSGCPASGAFAKTIEDNDIASRYYIDASVSYGFDVASMDVEAFLNVRNLLNRDPEIIPQGPTDFTYVFPLSKGVSGFDMMGRQFLLGVRIRM